MTGDEKALWNRLYKAYRGKGHLERREFNPIDGVPDVSYCFNSVEGHIELKHCDDPPTRATSMVFGSKGMRDTQIAWMARRIGAGGRAYIFAQVGRYLFLVHGGWAKEFNSWTLKDFISCCVWWHRGPMRAQNWVDLLYALIRPKHAALKKKDGG